MTTTPPERFATGGFVPARTRVPVDLNAEETVWPASALDDFTSRDGDLGGTEPAPFEQRDLGPLIREQERLVAQIAEVTDVTEPDPVTWEDVQVIARLAENGMATQAAEHAIELRRAWDRGRDSVGHDLSGVLRDGVRATPSVNPYPETTPASAPVTIDGDTLTWRQLPVYAARLRIALREAQIEYRTIGARIAGEVIAERGRQDLKWGPPQDLPDGTGPKTQPLRPVTRLGVALGVATKLEKLFKQVTDDAMRRHTVTYADILLEGVFEALAAGDPAQLRAELIQVSAVAQKWVQVIDERPAVEPA